jgi:hypothetical protein
MAARVRPEASCTITHMRGILVLWEQELHRWTDGKEVDMQPNAQPGPYRGGHRLRGPYNYRSVFWAIVLITVGVVWLLANVHAISNAQTSTLMKLWPILLVGVGVDLLIGHRSLYLGALVGVVTVGITVVLMLLGPSLGWAEDTTVKSQTFTAPVGQAATAHVRLDLAGYAATIHALGQSQNADRPLVTAVGQYVGTVDFSATGDAEKTVLLKTSSRFWGWRWFGDKSTYSWDIGLDPGIPLYLAVDSGSGKKTVDLSKLQLASVDCGLGSGEMVLTLPVMPQSVAVSLDVSSGDMNAQVPDGAKMDMTVSVSSGDARVVFGNDSDATMTIRVSSGQMSVNVPIGAAVRVQVANVSSGDVKVPSGLNRVGGGEGKEGSWETPGYGGAAHKIAISVENVSSGSVVVKQGG